ncbi:hypothetical protein LCGC14_0424770 [marine sediment metagenome]|uniref:Uncharacterized protein n=1 Tax=marine sediment metagenome TaxID=412755 RepID=A0A0F9SPU5_9ZZZZ
MARHGVEMKTAEKIARKYLCKDHPSETLKVDHCCLIGIAQAGMTEGRRIGLREALHVISDAFESYNYGDRPQSPPVILMKIENKIRNL